METYKNPQSSVSERVEDLLLRMTIEEKIGQLSQVPAGTENTEEVGCLIKAGRVGSRILAFTAHAGSEKQLIVDITESNEAQRIAVEESRLGIPVINGKDVIHGYRTSFPIPLAQAASFDPQLVEEAASFMALEASAEAVHWTFAPMLDISRDPRWGRIIEGFGEDPYLCSAMASASVRGIQGEDMSKDGKIAACAKHYIGYGAAEGGRDYNSVEISDNTLRNIYLPPFKAAVEAGVSTIMSAFHENGGEPVTASKYLLTDVLKGELGFNGFVISDWDSVKQLLHQSVAANEAEAAEIAFNAGVDMEMASSCYEKHIKELIKAGKIDIERVEDAVRRILTIKFKLGLFEKPYTDINLAKDVMLKPEHLECAKRLASRSMVLLKNNNVLPLSSCGIKIAVIGPMAKERKAMNGSWCLDSNIDRVVTVEEGMRTIASEVEIITSSGALTDNMIYEARKADIIVAVLGESDIRNGEGNCIADILLPPGQTEMIELLKHLGKPIVSVICSGRPLNIERVCQLSDAVLYAWHPGTQGGLAVADILFGHVNPSGKLPVTFLNSIGQVPLYYNHKSNGRPIDDYYNCLSGWNYQDSTGKPLFPFGYGLSYTTFKYDSITLNKEVIKVGDCIEVSANVTNTGSLAGEEVVQCYIRDKVASCSRPVKELKGFKRVFLKPGDSERVSFALGMEELSFYGRDGSFQLEPGKFTVWIGGDCMSELKVEFEVSKSN